MPIFEYSCEQCGNRFEFLVQGDESVTCLNCGSDKLKKLLSAFAVGKSSSLREPPACAAECGGGFNRGACGSGMCGCR